MNKEEVTMLGFEIVAYAGEARSKLLEALNKAESKDFDEAERLIVEANKVLNLAHNKQTEMLSKEAGGEDIAMGLIMMHGQDHLMTTILLKDLINHLINLYKK
ncbi:PTS lactose transporter subunit IIA [Streptococcus penaeicida]|uniref:PTS system lactose-specific EIIA component n=1 Tax=Streptococcus penaeicida TaxID=1765960 RepID=A0A2N8LE60_9STRE|nr:PTS lactose/cellobiose transporter subunit IIA [Streptococcus penaeicida]PND48447.1 PTS lactose transporter subunit IIA [Streptococcus penaeicida]